jgi:hypothetical protein
VQSLSRALRANEAAVLEAARVAGGPECRVGRLSYGRKRRGGTASRRG